MTKTPKTVTTSGWSCQECGHKFKTVKAAEKAAFGDTGCPKCGGADIDLSPEGYVASLTTGATK